MMLGGLHALRGRRTVAVLPVFLQRSSAVGATLTLCCCSTRALFYQSIRDMCSLQCSVIECHSGQCHMKKSFCASLLHESFVKGQELIEVPVLHFLRRPLLRISSFGRTSNFDGLVIGSTLLVRTEKFCLFEDCGMENNQILACFRLLKVQHGLN